MQVALFVEGSTGIQGGAFERIWQEALVTALDLRRVDRVYPISKKHLIAMDPGSPPMSGAGEPLDALIARKLEAEPFDAAVVAWDLMPSWAEVSPSACRWRETQELYRLLAASRHLPKPWSGWAARKDADLRSRKAPAARAVDPRLERYATLAICMEPDFEGLIVASERGVRRALGLAGRRIAGWPTRWRDPGVRRPEIELLQPALLAARAVRPPPREARVIRGDLRTAKHEWGAYFVSALCRDPEARTEVAAHGIARRLREILPRSTGARARGPEG